MQLISANREQKIVLLPQQLQKLQDTKKANEIAEANAAPAKDNIEFEDFMKMDVRAGTVVACEKVAKTKKLLKLTVDTGIDTRNNDLRCGRRFRRIPSHSADGTSHAETSPHALWIAVKGPIYVNPL